MSSERTIQPDAEDFVWTPKEAPCSLARRTGYLMLVEKKKSINKKERSKNTSGQVEYLTDPRCVEYIKINLLSQ